MKYRDFLENWGLKKLKISAGFLEAEFNPNDPDREAAWELYIELLTRVATQPLPRELGCEKSALASIYSVFGLTRQILRKHGSGCGNFTKLAIPILNQVLRPFTTKWHQIECDGFAEKKEEFRNELEEIQSVLGRYTQALAAIAGVEDLTRLETDGEAEEK